MNDKECMPEPDEIDAQLQLIAKMLVEARAPVIYGLTQLTIEAQELAVELAMCLRGAIDTPRGHLITSRGTSLQLHGEMRSTSWELFYSVDLFVFIHPEPWKAPYSDLQVTALAARDFLFSRKYHVVLNPFGPSPESQRDYDAEFVSCDGKQFATIVREFGCLDERELAAQRKKRTTPHTNSKWDQFLAVWQAAKFPCLVYDQAGLFKAYGRAAGVYLIEQLERVVSERAKYGRATVWPMEAKGPRYTNLAGAEYILIARTGYPAAVCCFNGCAEYLPGVTNAESLLADGVIDAALFLGEGPSSEWSEAAQQQLQKIPSAIIASKGFLQEQVYKHQIACSDLCEEQGTIVREDGIPLPLRPSAPPVASAEKFLRRLLALIREPAVVAAGAAQ